MTTAEQEYESFEILIGAATEHGYPVSVIESPAGETENTIYCAFDSNDQEIQYGLELLASCQADADLVTAVGSEFFSKLFIEPIDALFRSSLAMVRSYNRYLRLRLRVEPPELHTLPWELLFDPDEQVNLGTAADISLVRHFPQRIPVRPTDVRLPLRLLVAMAMPDDIVALDVEREKAIIQQALNKDEKEQQVTIHFVENATPATLIEALRSFQPHIFHFVGHGFYEDGQAYAVLENESGRAQLISDSNFREICLSSRETRLVVLNACQSAVPVGSRSFVGLAPSLLQRQISAVIAMQYPIRDEAALIFTRHFYHSVATGFPIDLAISEARRSILVELGMDRPDWAAPVLYLRAKNSKLFSIVQPLQLQAIDIPVPPPPTPLPVTSGFVGREAELAYCHSKLTETGIAAIVGMPGCGKSSIAAQLALEFTKSAKVFWHDFRRNEGADVLIWKLAGFLAWHGQPSVWQMLHGVTHTANHLPPFEVLLDYVLQAMKGRGYLICLDDFQHLADDPLLEKLSERLHLAVLNGEIQLLIASQLLPNFVLAVHHKPLDGLSIVDTEHLLATHNVTLSKPLLTKLYSSTEGNPELLTLAIQLFGGEAAAGDIVERLIQVEDVKRFLLSEIDQNLSDTERETMNGLAILLGHPGTRDAVEEVLGGRNIRRALAYLLNRYLLQEVAIPANRAYLQHRILQEFYYDLLSRQERQAMHQRAAEWYGTEEFDLFKSALHYFYAGDITRAVSLATQDVWSLINLGQSSALNRLLQNFVPQRLGSTQRLQVKLAQGQILSFWGQSEAAKECYQEVLAQTDRYLDDTVVRSLRVRTYLGLGELLQLESPKEALTWLKHGLEISDGSDSQLGAGLHIAIGTIQMWLGNYQPAKTELQLGLASLPSAPSQLRATALENLGAIAVEDNGDFEQGIAYTLDALQIARQLYNHFKIAEILTTLGSYRFHHGDWSGALANLREALTLSEQIGSERAIAFAQITFGSICMDADQGNEEEAKAHLEFGLLLAQKTNQRIDECIALMNLGELNIRLNNLLLADDYLNKAEAMIIQIGNRHYLPTIYSSRAQINLSMDDNSSALTNALNAVSLARELGEEITLGTALRVLGQSYNALGQYTQALSAFTESAAILDGKYPFELARTQANWAKSLYACGDITASISLKQAAEIIFRTLNAMRDLATLE